MSDFRRAVITTARGKVVVKGIPIPIPELLVRIHAVGLDPTDRKSLERVPAIGSIIGVDFSGIVEAVGEHVTSLHPGHRVAGFDHWSVASNHEYGAFAEVVLAFEHLTIKVPKDMSFEQGAVLGVGVTTVGQALCQTHGLPFPALDTIAKGDEFVLVYGGSTATGILAIQLARLSGARVVCRCNPRDFVKMKALGAEAAFDYVCEPLILYLHASNAYHFIPA